MRVRIAAPKAILLGLLSLFPAGNLAARDEQPAPPSLVLVTLDTTRADHLGSYGSKSADTPTLDALASRGTRYANAVSSSPLTLPSHASLLTGLTPVEHGVRDNGAVALDASVPTLATMFSARGYQTAAFVSSRVLDRRFGLASGFETYDDLMTAESLGQYGYPERDAEAVTTAAIDWLAGLPPDTPFFLWVHYYDPHLPYAPPAAFRRGSTAGDYAGEIAFTDRQVGRLLEALPTPGPQPLIAVVGDHGEALGEHGEESHGIFLYSASLDVPLLLAGPEVPRGQVVEEVVASRRLSASLLGLLGALDEAERLGAALPGLPTLGDDPPPEAVFSEARMPTSAYGWSPLTALTDQSWRFIEAPRPELYDLADDPAEALNLHDRQPERAARMRRELEEMVAAVGDRPAGEPVVDPQLAADLRALGYLSGAEAEAGEIDPKDGIAMLAEWQRAKQTLQAGDARTAVVALRALAARNPENVPFLTHLARAELASGETEAGLAALRRAVELNPRLDFLHLNLADAYLGIGRLDAARTEFERTLELNPRADRAWLGLAELALRSGKAADELRLLSEAVEAGTRSATIHARLGQIEEAAGRPEAAEAHFVTVTELAPDWSLGWLLAGRIAEDRGLSSKALDRYRKAAALGASSPDLTLRLGRLELAAGDPTVGRRHLESLVAIAPTSAEGRQARRLLDDS